MVVVVVLVVNNSYQVDLMPTKRKEITSSGWYGVVMFVRPTPRNMDSLIVVGCLPIY